MSIKVYGTSNILKKKAIDNKVGFFFIVQGIGCEQVNTGPSVSLF